MEQKIPTNQGNLTATEILDLVSYNSYATQREAGMTHEQCIKIGLGNETMATRYEEETINHKQP